MVSVNGSDDEIKESVEPATAVDAQIEPGSEPASPVVVDSAADDLAEDSNVMEIGEETDSERDSEDGLEAADDLGNDEGEELRDDWREAVVEEFSSWLYELTDEDIEAVEAEAEDEGSEPDLFTLLGEFTALRQELRQQSRVFKTTAEGMVSGMSGLRSELTGQARSLEAAASDIKSQIPTARREARESVIIELLTVRDSIQDALDAFKGMPAPKTSWLSRPDPRFEPLVRSTGAALAKADDTLRRLGVSPIAEVGGKFDPKTMRAVAAATDAAPGEAGKIVKIYRQGYAGDGKVLRPAEVEVSK